MSCVPWLSSVAARGSKIVVAGPPCSGKTTFAQMHALDGDEILDYDVVHAELTGLPLYVHDPDAISRVTTEFGRRAKTMRHGWIITSSPTAAARQNFRETHAARSIVLRVWAGECLARLERSDRPDVAKARLRVYIDGWWKTYRADHEAQTSYDAAGIPRELSLTHFEVRP